MVLRYNARLCESITRKIGGEVAAHRIQMWNVVWVSQLLLLTRQKYRPHYQQHSSWRVCWPTSLNEMY